MFPSLPIVYLIPSASRPLPILIGFRPELLAASLDFFAIASSLEIVWLDRFLLVYNNLNIRISTILSRLASIVDDKARYPVYIGPNFVITFGLP